MFSSTWEKVLLGDLSALLVAFIISLYKSTDEFVDNNYPIYLSKMIVSFLSAINMMISSYFFSSTELSEWVGLFSSENFTNFFVMSLILGLGWHLN